YLAGFMLNIQHEPETQGAFAVTVLRIDASIQGPRSASSELADIAEAEWLAVRPQTTFVRRHLGTDPLPADAWASAIHAKFVPEEQHTDEQRRAHTPAGTPAG